VKYRDGEKKIIVGPSVPVHRLEMADRSELKSGAAVASDVSVAESRRSWSNYGRCCLFQTRGKSV
jgi:hypothetical protein